MKRIVLIIIVSSNMFVACSYKVVNGCTIKPNSLCRGSDLAHTDLSEANLYGADLSGADLRGTNLYRSYLRWTDLRGADLSGADLTEVDLRMALYNSDTLWPEGVIPAETGAELMIP
jgi:uncharacterized protein YjbI with pentapeptide repeats